MRRNISDRLLPEAACERFTPLSKTHQLRAESIRIRLLMNFGFSSTPKGSRDSRSSEKARKESIYTNHCEMIESGLQDEDSPQR